MQSLVTSIPGRGLAFLMILFLILLGCDFNFPLKPSSGAPEYQSRNFVTVPGGMVNAAGGNLLVQRLDISLDTILGTHEIRATYNAIAQKWLWNFQMSYDGSVFEDPTGAEYDLSGLVDGAAIPGTVWVRVDSDTIKTKGGRAFNFDADGSLSSSHWATMPYPRIEYGADAISQCTSPALCTAYYALQVNSDGNPTSITDLRSGRIAEFQYDFRGQLVVARSPLDVENGWDGFRYEYDASGALLTAMTSSEGERIEYEYVDKGQIRSVIQIGEGNPTHQFQYYGKNQEEMYRTVHTSPLGGKTRYSFDSQRRLHSIELLDTEEREFATWEGLRPITRTSANGATTFYTYVDDDVATVTRPSGNVVTYSYAPGAVDPEHPMSRPVARVEDSLGLLGEFQYDALGRCTSIENGEGEITEFTYDAAILASATAPFGAEVTFPIYGVHGHWIEAGSPLSEVPIKRAFDAVGNMEIAGAGIQEGGILFRSFDANRTANLIHVAATRQGRVTSSDYVSIAHRSDGLRVNVLRPQGADHEMDYDALGRLVEVRERVDGEWHATRFEWDLGGNVTARELPNGMREEISYDTYGRPVRKAAFRDGVFEGELVATYYNGLIESVYDSIRGVTQVFDYDFADRVESVMFLPNGEFQTFDYDVRGHTTRESYFAPSGAMLRGFSFEYDLVGRLRKISDDDGTIAEAFYEDGLETRVEYGNGLVREAEYEPGTGKLVGYTTWDATDTIVEATTIDSGVDQNPPRGYVSSSTQTPIAATEEHYWMGLTGSLSDPDKLVGNRVWGWDDGEGRFKEYVYDELSNLVSNSSGDSYTYNDERNRLLSATLSDEQISLDYVYDEAGYVIERSGVPITWTATGRLASLGPVTIEWDMALRPISISVGGVTRQFALFGGRVEGDPINGAVGNVDYGVASVSLVSGETLYRHRDFRGNVSFVSDDTGAIVGHYRYSAYGLDAVFGPSVDSRGFAGGTELGDGLVLLGARVYDSYVGRFLSPDFFFNELNQFAYALGNPIDFWDPSGLSVKAARYRVIAGSLHATALGLFAVAAVVALFDPPAAAAMTAVGLAFEAESALYENEANKADLEEELQKEATEGGTQAPREFDVLGANSANQGRFASSGLGSFSGSSISADIGGELAVMILGDSLPGACPRAPLAFVHLSRGMRAWLWMLVALQLLLGIIILSRRRVSGEECDD